MQRLEVLISGAAETHMWSMIGSSGGRNFKVVYHMGLMGAQQAPYIVLQSFLIANSSREDENNGTRYRHAVCA